ncbi:MAG: NifB/NifX family molybdenum-iron cluster-binding protein [Desulfotignum sp.]|nr:NifB/NifX family molybdenum-iron cluster-binding protein [Desulfotignum sp.]
MKTVPKAAETGIQAASYSSKGARAVLTGNCGPKAMDVFLAENITVYTGQAGSVRQAVEAFKNGTLAASTPQSPDAGKSTPRTTGGQDTPAPVSGRGVGGGGSMGEGRGMGKGGGRGGGGMGGGGGQGVGSGRRFGRRLQKKPLTSQAFSRQYSVISFQLTAKP